MTLQTPSFGQLAFQQYLHYYYNKTIIKYYCNTNSYTGINPRYNILLPVQYFSITKFTIPRESGTCLNMIQVKKIARDGVHSTTNYNQKCTLMLLSNLAEPDWIPVSCNKKLLYYIICVKKVNHSTFFIQKERGRTFCKASALFVQGKCLEFISINNKLQELGTNIINNTYKNSYEKLLKVSRNILDVKQFKKLTFIFFTISESKYIPVFFLSKKLQQIAVKIFNNIYQPYFDFNYTTKSTGVASYIYNVSTRTLHYSFFECERGGFILSDFVCDFTVHCTKDSSDETNCLCSKFTYKCPQWILSKRRTMCSPLFYKSKNGICKRYNTNSIQPIYNKHAKYDKFLSKTDTKDVSTGPLFVCENNIKIDISLVNDLVPDCGQSAEDEDLLTYLLTNISSTNLCKYDEIPCIDGHIRCYTFVDVCIYQLNRFDHLTPCRNGAHLQNCSLYECNLKYKCKDSYCIFWTAVCDGKWDCPYGDDEYDNIYCRTNFNCADMFKCKSSRKICIHLGNICDKRIDCPDGDDEMYCNLIDITCPVMCQCLHYSIACSNVDATKLKNFASLQLLVSVAMFDGKVHYFSLLETLNTANVLILQKIGINEACHFHDYRKILHLDLSKNFIRNLKSRCFTYIHSIINLDLSRNNIQYFQSQSFLNLTFIKCLDLSNNELSILYREVFKLLQTIKIINMTNIKPIIREDNIFSMTNPIIIMSSEIEIICSLPGSISSHHLSGFSFCDGTFSTETIRVAIVSVIIAMFSLNVLSILLKQKENTKYNAFSVISIAINIHHFLCVLYLSTLWISSVKMPIIFIISEAYRSSFVCLATSGILLCFEMLDQSLLLYLSIIQLLTVTNPFAKKYKSPSFSFRWILIFYFISIVFSFIFTLLYKISWNTIPTSLCSFFISSFRTCTLLCFITWFIVLCQIFTIVTIVILGVTLLRKIKQVRKEFSAEKIAFQSSSIIQLVAIAIPSLICWLPMNIIYVYLLHSTSYPRLLLLWSTILILPINSLLHPIIFVINIARNILKTKRKKERLITS